MTQDEIIEMADKAKLGSKAHFGFVIYQTSGTKELEAFAKLVAAKEREACAKIAEKQLYVMNISLTSLPAQNGTAAGILNQIRSRGEQQSCNKS